MIIRLSRTLFALFFAICFCTLSSTTQALAQSQKLTMPLQQDAAVLRWIYDKNGYGEMMIVAVIAPVDNKVAVCGAYSIIRRVSAGVKRSQLLSKSRSRTSVWLDGVQILDGMRRLNRVSPDELVVGTPANCVLTQHRWKSSYSNDDLELRAASMTSF